MRSRSLLSPAALALALGFAFESSVGAQVVDTATVLGVLREARSACEADAGAMWGRSLCGPVAVVERSTRLAIANDTVSGRAFLPYADAWAGVLPPNVPLANTSFRWGDRGWAIVVLPLPEQRLERLALILHESFHREQEALGLPAGDPAAAHLDERDGRLWLRLELRALAAALETRDLAASRRHAADALTFRAMRAAITPGADTLEAILERHEGMAEYTGLRLAMNLTGDSNAVLAIRIREMETRSSYVRAFAYATGPALGFLLDRFSTGWRDDVLNGAAPAPLLARALNFRLPTRLRTDAERRARQYQFANVRAEEDRRHLALTERLAALRARLVVGPTLTMTQSNLSTVFDPNAMVPLGEHGTVYPTGTFSAEWGKLEVRSGGALVSPDFRRVTVAAPIISRDAPISGDRINGEGWTLELAQGWVLASVEQRAGNFEVRRRQ